jgi:hypothetical protein
MQNISSYEKYVIRDGDKPETLAEKAYGNPEAHWIILYANDILDPHYDWPMDNRTFDKYIVKKYASQANMNGVKNVASWAKTNYIMYEKVITRENLFAEVSTISRYQIDSANVATAVAVTDPYDTYTSLAESTYDTFNVGGKDVIETVKAERISYFDYEIRENEKKREINIIKKQYYGRIMSQFDNLTQSSGANDTFIRRFT